MINILQLGFNSRCIFGVDVILFVLGEVNQHLIRKLICGDYLIIGIGFNILIRCVISVGINAGSLVQTKVRSFQAYLIGLLAFQRNIYRCSGSSVIQFRNGGADQLNICISAILVPGRDKGIRQINVLYSVASCSSVFTDIFGDSISVQQSHKHGPLEGCGLRI